MWMTGKAFWAFPLQMPYFRFATVVNFNFSTLWKTENKKYVKNEIIWIFTMNRLNRNETQNNNSKESQCSDIFSSRENSLSIQAALSHSRLASVSLWSRMSSLMREMSLSSLFHFLEGPGRLSSSSSSSTTTAWSAAAALGPGVSSGMEAIRTGGAQWKASALTPHPWGRTNQGQVAALGFPLVPSLIPGYLQS